MNVKFGIVSCAACLPRLLLKDRKYVSGSIYVIHLVSNAASSVRMLADKNFESFSQFYLSRHVTAM